MTEDDYLTDEDYQAIEAILEQGTRGASCIPTISSRLPCQKVVTTVTAPPPVLKPQ